MKVIIIEDESLMAVALKEAIERLSRDIEVVQILSSVREALNYFSDHDLPELFFSDIHLPDGLSFEIFRQLATTTPVIFCTAFDQYALEAFQLNGIDYLLKPFDDQALERTLSKYDNLTKNHINSFDAAQMLQYFSLNKPKQDRNLLVYQGEKIIPIKKKLLAILHKKDGITYAFTFDHKRYVLDANLDQLERSLGNDFFRANRQVIIHREAIKEVVRFFGRKLVVHPNLSFKEQIIISKAKAASFLDWLQGNA